MTSILRKAHGLACLNENVHSQRNVEQLRKAIKLVEKKRYIERLKKELKEAKNTLASLERIQR